jgi:leucyl-tRNA synthetase
VKKTGDIDTLSLNTAISAMMVLSNHLLALPAVPRSALESLVLVLSPFAPHVCEEVWEKLGHGESLALVAHVERRSASTTWSRWRCR